MDEKKARLEAALFIAEDPLTTDEISDVLNVGARGYVQDIVDQLQEDLEDDHRGLEIIETDEGYQMQVKKQFVDHVKHLAQHQDLDDAALRTLSLIAYNAPVKQNRIIEIRGNRAYSQIKELESRGLIQSEKEGRTKSLDITDSFLDYFGLESIQEFRRQADASSMADLEETEDDAEEGQEPDRTVAAEEGTEETTADTGTEDETEETDEEHGEDIDEEPGEDDAAQEEPEEEETTDEPAAETEDDDGGSLISPPTKTGED